MKGRFVSISRRALVKGSAWSVPAVAVAATAPALALSSSDLILKAPAFYKSIRPAVVKPAPGEMCSNRLLNTVITTTPNHQTRQWATSDGGWSTSKVDRITAWGPRLEGLGATDKVVITHVSHSFSVVSAPVEGKEGFYAEDIQNWVPTPSSGPGWTTPTYTGTRVYQVGDKQLNGVLTPNGPLHFRVYTSEISAPATVVRDVMNSDGSSTRTIFVDVPFQFTNKDTGNRPELKVEPAQPDAAEPGSVCPAYDIAYYAYKNFTVTYTVNGRGPYTAESETVLGAPYGKKPLD